jgi:hypothetical protein
MLLDDAVGMLIEVYNDTEFDSTTPSHFDNVLKLKIEFGYVV